MTVFPLRYLTVLVSLTLGACATGVEPQNNIDETNADGIKADVWTDNWFEMYFDGRKVLEDSVPITTERSFNAETATVPGDMPRVIAIKAMDFKENDSGLEYIGTARQQMGDGGLIAQFTDTATGETLAATNNDTRCLVVHRAPLDRSCAGERNPVAGEGACGFIETDVPQGWTRPDFDDSEWPRAVEHNESDVRPKDGYDKIRWSRSAKLIWSADLIQDNTLLCRITIRK